MSKSSVYRPPQVRHHQNDSRESFFNSRMVSTQSHTPVNLPSLIHDDQEESETEDEVEDIDKFTSIAFSTASPLTPSSALSMGWRSKHASNHESNRDDEKLDWTNAEKLVDQRSVYLSNPIESDHSTCSSCGTASIDRLDPPVQQSFVQLLPCHHLVCPTCLNSLVNATSNDPPRSGNCFACQQLVVSFSGVAFVDPVESLSDLEEVGFRTPPGSLRGRRASPLTPNTIPGLSPFRKLDWSESVGTPDTTPGRLSVSSDALSMSKYEIPAPIDYPVVRIDNIPWDLTVEKVKDWLPQEVETIQDDRLFVHILCNRADGKTLNQLYFELPNLQSAHRLVRLQNGRKMCNRPISVGLTNQSELLSQIFPDWGNGFDGVDAIVEPFTAGEGDQVLITDSDLVGLVDLCRQIETNPSQKAAERSFMNVISIVSKVPWHQSEVYDDKLVAKIYKLVESAVDSLVKNSSILPRAVFDTILNALFKAILGCPVFRSTQKSKLLQMARIEINSSSPTASPIRSTSAAALDCFQSPTFDRLKSSPASGSLLPRDLVYLSQVPASPTPVRQSFMRSGLGMNAN